MIGFLNFQCFCPGLDLSALTEWFRARTGAFPNRVFESEEGYFATISFFADQSCKATDLFPASRLGTFRPLRFWQTNVKSHGLRAASGWKVSMLA
jgi:hypothetical protein